MFIDLRTTTITVPRNNLRTKSRPIAHARNVVTTFTNFKDKFSPLSTLFISNSRLLRSKTDELASTVAIYSVEVAVITETWLSVDGPRTATDLPGYSLIRHDIPNRRRGGGVCAYVKDLLPLILLSDLSYSDF